MTTKFTFDIDDDFTNGINVQKLKNEIFTDLSKSVHIRAIGGKIKLDFDVGLDAGEITTLNNTITSHDAETAPIKGYWANDNSVSSTTRTTYQQKLKLQTPYLEAGNYIINWSYNYKPSGREIDIRVQLNDEITINQLYWRPKINNSEYIYANSGFSIQNLSEGIHEIDIDYKGANKGTTIIWNVGLTIKSTNI